MIKIITHNIEIVQDFDETFLNLDGDIKKYVSDFDNIEISNTNYITQNQEDIETQLYLNKDICIEYIENISDPSHTVPNTDSFRYLVKQNNEYLFSKTPPKPIETITTDYINSLQFYDDIYDCMIATDLYSSGNSRIFSLPYGGLDKYDSYIFIVDNNFQLIRIDNNSANITVDYVEGLIYIESNDGVFYDILFVVCIGNLVPLKIINKGLVKIEETESNYYKAVNISDNNLVKLEYLNYNSVLLTTLKDILFIPNGTESLPILVDGVHVKLNQQLFFKKNETILIEKVNSEGSIPYKNIEYLSHNSLLQESLANDNKEQALLLNTNNNIQYNGYEVIITNKENKNTYIKNQPIRLTLF